MLFSTDETTALALAGLLPRFCDPAAGQVLFDGRDLRLATLDSVRRQVALILSDHILTSGTLAQNIAGDAVDYTQDEIVAAVKHVHADEFVQSLPDGLQTMVGPHGQALSTGQAISVGLARVALHRPSVVVIEEPREVLDQVPRSAWPSAGKNNRQLHPGDHRPTPGNVPCRRRILLFHEGRLLADGTHQELLQHNELYRHLNYVRFNEFRGKVS